MQCLFFQLESVLSTASSSHKHACLLQPHDVNVVAAAVRPAVLHALVSPFMFLVNVCRTCSVLSSSSAHILSVCLSPSSQLLAASSQHLRPDQPSTQPNQPDPLSQRPQADRRGNPEVQMNAQGGEILNEEDLNWDWLDWVYTFSRAAILLSIVYFYSSFSRFVMVMMAMLVLYLCVILSLCLSTSARELENLGSYNSVWLFLSAGTRPAGSPSTWRTNSSSPETEPIRTIWRESYKITTYKKWSLSLSIHLSFTKIITAGLMGFLSVTMTVSVAQFSHKSTGFQVIK